MRASALSTTEPSRLLFGAYHRNLLGLLLLRPELSFHLREIERLTGVPSGPAHRELKRMERAGLLTTHRVGNQVRYQANRDCAIFAELAGIFRKTTGLADVLREALAPVADRIESAFIFGSVASGQEGPHSDVDLLVVGDLTFEDVVAAVNAAEQRMGRAVNPVVMSRQDFVRRRARGDRFIARVLAEPRLILIGAADEP